MDIRIGATLPAVLAGMMTASGQIGMTAPGEPVSMGGAVQYAAPFGFDADALGYCVRANITDATARRQISDFAKGLKVLGLWQHIACWPLREPQNAAAGATMHSLGGLGPCSATLQNGPARGANGVVLSDAGTQWIRLPAFPLTNGSNFALGFVARMTSTQGNGDSVGADDGGPYLVLGWGPAGQQTFIIQNDGGTAGPATGETVGAWQSIFGSRQRNTAQGRATYRNGVTHATLASNNATISFPVAGWIAKLRNETLAFAFLLNTNLTPTTAAQLHALYRDTLGAGLGLP